ncbi:DUF6932 family protein [Rheinheimera nanhaiensis]|uniref:DUF6932 family protein n=1 Tax=Rheinheimera nanhaiensis TaxID=1163621 RepID=UPI00058DC276
MIPKLLPLPGVPWCVLPPGIHFSSMNEVKTVFAHNPHRRRLFDGFYAAANALAKAGCKTIYLDGSFVTEKDLPSDYDGCWDTAGVDLKLLDPVLITFDNSREAQKAKYYGEIFPAHLNAGLGLSFINFFQVEKISGSRKGIIAIDLTKEPFLDDSGGSL